MICIGDADPDDDVADGVAASADEDDLVTKCASSGAFDGGGVLDRTSGLSAWREEDESVVASRSIPEPLAPGLLGGGAEEEV